MNAISIFIVLLITIITIIYNFPYVILSFLLNATRGAYLSLASSQPVNVGRAKSANFKTHSSMYDCWSQNCRTFHSIVRRFNLWYES